MAYAESVVDDIQSRVDLVELIGRVTPLKHAGRHWKGLCPFHQEKTPSLTVSPEKQLYYCFGCQAGGNAFTFVMQTQQLTFPEAMEQLAAQVGVTLEPASGAPEHRHARDAIIATNELALRYFQEQLRGSDGAAARAYLAQRGVSDQTRDQFRIGLAPDGWDGLLQYAARHRCDGRELAAAGLALERRQGQGMYDRFRHRLMFPIQDAQGRAIGFGGRILANDQEPKYLNSPETAAFAKGRHLYGLAQSKQQLQERGAVLVEGYMDCIILHQAGVTETVAPLGVALTEAHARLLKRYTTSATLLFDEDEAGAQATLRSLDVLVAEGLTVRVARLESPLDPDEFVLKHGADAFHARLKQSQSLFEYKLAWLRRQHATQTVEDRVAICHDMLSTLRRVPDEILRRTYAQRLSRELQLDERTVAMALVNPRQLLQRTRPAAAPRVARAGDAQAETMLVGLLLEDAALIGQVLPQLTPAQFHVPLARELFAWMRDAQAQGRPIGAQHVPVREETAHLPPFIAEATHLADTCEEKSQALRDCLQRIQHRERETELQSLHVRIQAAEQSGDDQALYQLLKTFTALRKQGEAAHGDHVEIAIQQAH